MSGFAVILRVIGFILVGVGIFFLKGPAIVLVDIVFSILMTVLGFALIAASTRLGSNKNSPPKEKQEKV